MAYSNTADQLYRARQYQNQYKNRNVNQAPAYSNQQQDSTYQDFNMGRNLGKIYDKAIARQSDGMYNGIDVGKSDFSGWKLNGKAMTDKQMYDAVANGGVDPKLLSEGNFQQQLNMLDQGYEYAPKQTLRGLAQQQNVAPNIHSATQLGGLEEDTFAKSIAQQYGKDSVLQQAVQQGAAANGATAATTGATTGAEGVLANSVAQGASAIDGMAAASFMPEAELAALNTAGANVGAEMAMASQPVVEGAAAGASGAGGAATGLSAALPWAIPVGLLGAWDLSRGDKSWLRKVFG